jgi:hypothetical protein
MARVIPRPVVPEERWEDFRGDLIEEWAMIQPEAGSAEARRWFWGRVQGSLVPRLRRRWKGVLQILRREELAVRVIRLAVFLYLLPAILMFLLLYLAVVVGSFPFGFLRGQESPGSAAEARRAAEARWVRIARFGWERYLVEVGATVIDVRRNDIEGTHEALMQIPDGERILLCVCPSTARVHGLGVPPEIHTCQGAQAWLSNGLAGRIIKSA